MIDIMLFVKRKAFDGNTVLNNGKCKMSCNDLYITKKAHHRHILIFL